MSFPAANANAEHALQRTGSAVTAPAALHHHLSAHRQVPRPLRLSLSLGSYAQLNTPLTMTIDTFWSIIEDVHQQSPDDMDTKCETLRERLSALSPDDMRGFRQHFDECDARAYDWGLRGAAYIIHGGCSDDSFSDFRSSLISRGRADFEGALSDPDSLADLAFDEEDACYEGYAYAVTDAEQAVLGDVGSRVTPFPADPSGEQWDEDDDAALASPIPEITRRIFRMSSHQSHQGKRMRATARMASVVSSTLPARRRLIPVVRASRAQLVVSKSSIQRASWAPHHSLPDRQHRRTWLRQDHRASSALVPPRRNHSQWEYAKCYFPCRKGIAGSGAHIFPCRKCIAGAAAHHFRVASA